MKGNPVKGRFLMVTRSIPVESGGTMIVVRRLLENFGPEEVIVLGRTPWKTRVLKNDIPLHYPVVTIPMLYAKGFKLWRIISILVGIPLGIYVIWKKQVKIIVGVYPDMGSLTLSYILSRLTGKPLMAYFCDLYAENQKNDLHGKWAKWLQRRIFKNAKKIIVANAGMERYYQKEYGINAVCLPTAINDTIPETFQLPELITPFIIGYSGSVVKDRLDPMQALVDAIGNNPGYEIRLFTPQSEVYLKSEGIWADNVSSMFCASQQELMEQLSKCHLLYLPLTFKTGKGYNTQAQLATCFGIKAYEYFLSCRPILVHSPQDYFTSTFFAENKCGYILNSIQKDKINDCINNIKLDYEKQTPELIKNAIQAVQLFKGQELANRFTLTINAGFIN